MTLLGERIGGALEYTLDELLRQRLQQIVVPLNPAAGAELSVPVPAGVAWDVRSIRFQLVTSAVVANRVPALVIADPNRTLLTLGAGVNQAATLTQTYEWAKGSAGVLIGQPAVALVNGLPDFVIPEGGSIGTLTAARDVGDQYQNAVLVVRQWSLSDLELAAAWFARRNDVLE